MNAPVAPQAGFDFTYARDILERFMNLGESHMFRMTDGRAFEGWVVEIGEKALLVVHSGASDADDPVELALATIDLGTLRYLDKGVAIPFAVT